MTALSPSFAGLLSPDLDPWVRSRFGPHRWWVIHSIYAPACQWRRSHASAMPRWVQSRKSVLWYRGDK